VVAKQRKIRVELRKNRHKRTRANDLTQTYREDQVRDLSSHERVRAKGELSRRRTIMAEGSVDDAAGDSGALLAVDLASCVGGRVARIHGLESIVEADDGKRYRCGVRRLLKTLAIDERSVLAVGDRVYFRPGGTDQGLIEKVEPRSGVIVRGYRHRAQVIAANVDRILVISSLDDPPFKPSLIDRYLISSELGGVRPVIVLNKTDLVDLAKFAWAIGLYSQLGYEVVPTSAVDGRGLGRLKELVMSGVTAFSGQSGVGKSSLLNAIEPGLALKVAEVSDWTRKGKHTTTHAELLHLGEGGDVVDTPGLRQFELWGVTLGELEGFFPEFRAYVPKCRFPDCTHTHESACAVLDAVYWGQIHEGRYESYLKLFQQQPIEDE
jgi:ribosome biogenesis GTPase